MGKTRVITAVSMALLLGSFAGAQQSVHIDPPEIAAYGTMQDDQGNHLRVWETDIAAGSDRAVVVFREGMAFTGYAVRFEGAAAWSPEGVILPVDQTEYISTGIDPSVAYDAATGAFMAMAIGCPVFFGSRILESYCRQGKAVFDEWSVVRESTFRFDKTYVVAGRNNPGHREYYLTGILDSNLYYLRSVDGGKNWVGGSTQTATNFCPHPAVVDSNPLCVAYKPDELTIRFLAGFDNAGGGVDFYDLCGPSGSLLEIGLFHFSVGGGGGGAGLLPGDFKVAAGPQIAVDPTAGNRFYVVGHETRTSGPGDGDVNVYIKKITRQGPGCWIAGKPVMVNDPVTGHEADQFLPAVAVDDRGWIHVVFYDDRNYRQEDRQTDPPPRFDAYYAISRDQGKTFTNYNLNGSFDHPALDFRLTEKRPGEYIGIACHGNVVWASYVGTSLSDGTNEKSVIYASRIVVN